MLALIPQSGRGPGSEGVGQCQQERTCDVVWDVFWAPCAHVPGHVVRVPAAVYAVDLVLRAWLWECCKCGKQLSDNSKHVVM